jgi:hypothetical protein
MGRSLSKAFKDYKANRVRPPDYARALAELTRIRAGRLPAYLEVQQGLAQATCLLALNRPREAQTALRRVRELIGARPEFRDFVAELERLERYRPAQ